MKNEDCNELFAAVSVSGIPWSALSMACNEMPEAGIMVYDKNDKVIGGMHGRKFCGKWISIAIGKHQISKSVTPPELLRDAMLCLLRRGGIA
jgi:hypothetical protein